MEAIRMMTYPAHVRVTVTKPLPELGIILRVLVKRLNSVADDFHAHAISEALQQCAKLAEGLLHRSLRAHLLMIVLDCTQVSKAITWGGKSTDHSMQQSSHDQHTPRASQGAK